MRSLYIKNNFYYALAAIIILFILGYFFHLCYVLGFITLAVLFLLFIMNIILVYSGNNINAERVTPDRLSNGDENDITIQLTNKYPFTIKAGILDEAPDQFQLRDMKIHTILKKNEKKTLRYSLKPHQRGVYKFGRLNIYVGTAPWLIERRYIFKQDKEIAVYPSFIQMRKYELFAISRNLQEYGIKKLRRIGHNMEFEQIKEYTPGDDYRTVNWKATARRSKLMVNQFQDERSQQVYSVINMGRIMKMPFEGMSLLDYAINSSLVISNIAMQKYDKAGIISFSDKVNTILPAERKSNQLNKILEHLYRLNTGFTESNYEALTLAIRYKLNQRSLIILYTNFESMQGLQRQIKYLRQIARQHLLLIIFFENTELKNILGSDPTRQFDIYRQVVAEKFYNEKMQILKELENLGIQAILTKPQNLTVNTINKYIELKSRGMI